MNRILWVGILGSCLACNTPSEWTCELTVNDVDVCVDVKSRKYCEGEWGGAATASERSPGGPYVYCDDLYSMICSGSLVEVGDNFTANHTFYANSEEDCAAAAGGSVGG